MLSSFYKAESTKTIFDPKFYLRPGLTENDILQIKEVFEAFDYDKDGVLNPADIRNALLKFNYKASQETVLAVMSVYDEDEQGALNFVNFVNMCSKHHQQKGETKNQIRNVYWRYDKAKKGYLDINDLKRVSKELDEKTTDEMLDEMIKSMDSNMDDHVTFEDFYNAMTKKLF